MTAPRRPWLLLLWSTALSAAGGASASDHAWSRSFGAAADETIGRVAVDGTGTVVATGSFRGTVNFGGGGLTSAGDADIFLARFDAAGNHLWSKRFGDANAQTGLGVAVDGSGNVIVTGSFRGTVDFGGGPLASAGDVDIFLAKFNANGTHLWSSRFGGLDAQTGYGVACDGSGNVIVTGSFRGTVDFGGGALVSAGQQDAFLAAFTPAGAHAWSKRFGDASPQEARAVAVSSSGNVTVTGNLQGTADFGGGPLISAGGDDIFLARFTSTGTHVWSRVFGDANAQHGVGVAVDGSGNAVVTGDFAGSVNFGGGALTSAGGADVFLAKYDPTGTHLWSQAFGGAGTEAGTGVAADAAGNVVATGSFEGTVDFGGPPLTSAGGADIFVARYDPGGGHISSASYGATGTQQSGTVAVDPFRNMVVGGQFQGTVDFGGGPLSSAGGYDVFLVKFADLIFADGFGI